MRLHLIHNYGTDNFYNSIGIYKCNILTLVNRDFANFTNYILERLIIFLDINSTNTKWAINMKLKKL